MDVLWSAVRRRVHVVLATLTSASIPLCSYSWSETTYQYVKSGKGKYRSDCSGFVSATWDVDPPGA